MDKIFDYIVIGSGFGGSVSAMRLSEKGYDVLVIEKGKRFRSQDFPKSDWNIKKFLWAPLLRCFGFQNITFFRKITILSGVGVGGGSLVYGNTHMVPGDEFFQNPVWSHFKDWKSTLKPYYDKAKFMLGTIPYTRFNHEDLLLKEVAADMGKESSWSGVNVGVYYGDTEKPIDPYFNGHGPKRTGCVECAGCMVGCRYNAKNTLDKNYLYFAEKNGAEVKAETLVTKIEYDGTHYHIHTKSTTAWWGRNSHKVFKSKGLVVSGGVLGTMKLLLDQKYGRKTLEDLSDTLGNNIRTNSESLCGVSNAAEKMNNGVAISSYFNPDDHTHIEVVKYNDNSGLMGRLGTLAVGSGNGLVRTLKWIAQAIRQPINFLRITFNIKNWGTNSIIFLVMQSLDNAMRLKWNKGIFGARMSFVNDENMKVPAYIPVGQEVMHRYAKKVNGISQNVWPEILFNMPMTAHILGGCPMGENTSKGVVNDKFEVHNYPNMYVLDGSIIPCNLGVNPSLSITAFSEYAMDQIPDKPGNTRKKLEELLGNEMSAKV